MPDLSGSNYSEVDASNNNAAPFGMPEGMAPSGVNDAWRAGMGALKRAYDRDHAGSWVAVSGTGNAITLSYTTNPSGYVQGEKYTFIATAANSGPTTVTVGGLGTVNLLKRTAAGKVACSGGEITVGDVVEMVYDGATMQFGPPVSAGASLTSANAFTGINTFGAQVVSTPIILTSAATITPNFALGNLFFLTASTSAFTMAAPTNAQAGQSGMFLVLQDGTGNRVITWDSAFLWPGGLKAVLSTGAGQADAFAYCVTNVTPLRILMTSTKAFS